MTRSVATTLAVLARESEGRTPTLAVRAAAQRGLELHAAGHGGDGLRASTIEWARRLALGQPIPAERRAVMRAWFARHGSPWAEVAARTRQAAELRRGTLRGRAPALVAWLLWGGDAGRAWCERA